MAENSNEMSSLDSNLNDFLKQVEIIQNELNKMPNRPRNLIEIKTKREKTEKIEELQEKINQVRRRIRELNNGM